MVFKKSWIPWLAVFFPKPSVFPFLILAHIEYVISMEEDTVVSHSGVLILLHVNCQWRKGEGKGEMSECTKILPMHGGCNDPVEHGTLVASSCGAPSPHFTGSLDIIAPDRPCKGRVKFSILHIYRNIHTLLPPRGSP